MQGKAYYASPHVVIQSEGEGVLDVSDDVIDCSVTHNLDSVSTSSVSLNNYSNSLQGRYNNLFKISDLYHLDFYKNSTQYSQYSGYCFKAPQFAYDSSNFQMNFHDIIGLLQYKLWCPYSNEAIQKYFAPMGKIVSGAQSLGINDSGLGNVLLDFLMNVCGLSKDMIYIQKFPDINNIMKNILKATVIKGEESYSQEFENVFDQLMGVDINSSTIQSSTEKGTAKGNSLWQGFVKKYPIGTGEYATGNNSSLYYGGQCWALYESYVNYLFGWSTPGGNQTTQPAGGNGAYWQEAKNKTCNQEILNQFDILGPTSTAQIGDVAFWWKSGGLSDTLGQEYGHVAIVWQDNGNSLHVENQWYSGVGGFNSNGVIYSNLPKNASGYQLAGYLRPKIFTSNPPAPSSSSSIPSGSSSVNASLNNDYKLFQWINNLNWAGNAEVNQLNKYTNLYDNESVLGYIKQLCNGSMRSYTSLPDGSLGAFVPDYFGFFQQAGAQDNLITIDDIDLVDYSVSLDKSSYVSHCYALSNEQTQNVYDIGSMSDNSLSTAIRLMESSGTVSFQKQPKELSKLINIQLAGFQQSAEGFNNLMNKWGVSVIKPQASFLVSHVMTTIFSVYSLCKAWAKVFNTKLTLDFRPDIFPGMRLKIPALDNMTVFVNSVTHSWNSTTGGSTTVDTIASSFNGKA